MALANSTTGVQVLEALGLPSRQCTSLTIEFKPDSIVVAKATYWTDAGELDAVTEIVRTLKPVDG